MDDRTLAELEDMFEASPDNARIGGILVRAYWERDDQDKALSILESLPPDTFSVPEDRIVAARLWLSADNADKALSSLGGEEPEEWLLEARALQKLGRLAEGRVAYDKAVAADTTWEDPVLDKLLTARVVTPFESKKKDAAPRTRLRVISNDDTDETELSRLLAPDEESIDFESVGGLEEVKTVIRRRIILPFQKPSLFQRFKKRVGGGILMFGPPGCGKTLLARATAGECSAKFFNVTISDILDMYIGESERKLHAIFEKARQSTPSVLFFDELEGLGGKRQYTREATSSKLVSLFLSELDGFSQNNQGVLVLGATNLPWAIDPAFRRPGRFDRVQFVPPPDKAARATILEILLEGRPVEGPLKLDYVAKHTSGFSGADLQNLVETATDLAIEKSLEAGKETPIDAKLLAAALAAVKPTTLEWLTTARNYARYANEGGQYDDVLAFLDKHSK